MSTQKRLLLTLLIFVSVYFLISLLSITFNVSLGKFDKINLLSDVLISKSHNTDSASVSSPEVKIANKFFEQYLLSNAIINFSRDTQFVVLTNFNKKLKQKKSGKIRIAFLGDSMIEGDMLTETLRRLLQEKFGGKGVGFVPINSNVAQYRATASTHIGGDWQDLNFKSPNATKNFFFSGHIFTSQNGSVELVDNTINDTSTLIKKLLLTGKMLTPAQIEVNGIRKNISAPKLFNVISLVTDKSHRIKLRVMNDDLPCYGISFEAEDGVYIDNFSFRGVSGIELNKIDSALLCEIDKTHHYDLVVLQYGVNLLFKPNEKKFDWYTKAIIPIIKRLKKCLPNTDILLVSATDRAFRYANEYKTAIGIDELIKAQAKIAYETDCYFYNEFATMGGENTIVDWVKKSPSWAGRDYVHPNRRGFDVLANYFFKVLLNDYNKK